MLLLVFLPQKIWEVAGPTNDTFDSMNTGSVVGILLCGGDTQSIPHAKEFELFAITGSIDAKTLGMGV